MTERVAILLGADTGDVAQTFRRAAESVGKRVGTVAAASRIMWSEPWGFESDTVFGNQALAVDTDLPPEQVLDALQAIERECGRDRSEEARLKRERGSRYVSRRLDADIIFYGDAVIATPRLTVPHPLVDRREFALRPLAEIMPGFRHPQSGRSVAEMLRAIEKERL